MTISKRKLMTWRQAALKDLAQDQAEHPTRLGPLRPTRIASERILKLTQELIDQHLLAEAIKIEVKTTSS
ncbi:MAG: hypothetical protein GY845_03260 [Planctomycetes bacterium]|nr:hypothetical protein [Planctomycetota bacterium]